MSDFHIKLPDGREIVVDAPNEAAAINAANNFMMRSKGESRAKGGYLDNIGRQVAAGASLGFADEFAAGADATVGPAVDWGLSKLGWGSSGTSKAPSWSERYEQNLSSERGQDKAFEKENPGASTTAQVGGAIGGTLAMLPSALLRGGGSMLGMGAKNAGTGLGIGGAAGFGEGEGDFSARALNAAKHGLIGMGVGAAVTPLVAGAGAVGSAIAESGVGRAVADKVIAPGMRWAADKIDTLTPRMGGNLSAAAPDGVPVAGMAADTADALRAMAPSGGDILEDAAARRIADAMQRGGGTIPGMGHRLTELGEGAMIADANPMVTRLGRTAYISPGKAADDINTAMDARNRATGLRVGNSVRESFGETNPAVLETARLRGQRAGQGASDYAEAVGPDAAYTISPEMRAIMQEAPAVQKAMDTIMANAAERGVRLTPAQVAHRVKQQLASDADAAFQSGKAVNKEDVRSLADRWRSALHEANPAIRAADKAWEANTAKMDALELGRQFMRQGVGETADAVSPSVLAERIPQMSAEEARAFLAGAADTLYTKANSGMGPARQVAKAIDENQNLRAKLVSMLGEENASKLFNRSMSERTFASTDRTIRGGSDTAGKMLSALDDAASGGIPTSPGSILNRLIGKAVDTYNKQKAGNEDVRARIAKMLTETDQIANADALDRIAAQLSRLSGPRRLSRGVSGGASPTGQEF